MPTFQREDILTKGGIHTGREGETLVGWGVLPASGSAAPRPVFLCEWTTLAQGSPEG